jgi:thioesterase domain-containing protein
LLGVVLTPEEEAELGPSPSLPSIAACLARTIRKAQPEGPDYLGGWCAAGILAYEVGWQLTAAGQEVGLVLLLDAPNPTRFHEIGPLAREVSKLKHYVGKAMRLRGRDRWVYALSHAEGAFQRATQGLQRAAGDDPPKGYSNTLLEAAFDYRPKAYGGNVVLLQPTERPAIFDWRRSWAQVVTGQFSVLDLPGNHNSILENPHVHELARIVQACLMQAQSAGLG